MLYMKLGARRWLTGQSGLFTHELCLGAKNFQKNNCTPYLHIPMILPNQDVESNTH